MTRNQALTILAVREGDWTELPDHFATEDLIAAAKAPAGQPCSDCGKIVTWSDDNGWTHVDLPSPCFLA
jgi:hypothetical protein